MFIEIKIRQVTGKMFMYEDQYSEFSGEKEVQPDLETLPYCFNYRYHIVLII